MSTTTNDPAQDEMGERPRAEIGALFDAVVLDAKGWLETRKELIVLEVGERLGNLAGALMSKLILLLLVSIGLLMASLALGLWLGQVLDNVVYGFLCVGAIYLLLALIFALFGNKPVRERTMLHIMNAARDEETDL